jgi:transposase
MAKRHQLHLTDEQIQALRDLRDTGKPAYLRERAAALLKIAAGSSPHKVSQNGLLKRRKPDTLYAWLQHYRDHGIPGLRHKPGKGRKPAFAPLCEEDAESELRNFVNRNPALLPPYEARWTLRTLGASLPWLSRLSIPGVRSVLCRLGISYKRGRAYIHSPDVDYTQKLAAVQHALETAKQTPETHVAFYQDEFAFRCQPSLGKDWTQTGTKKPLAYENLGSDPVCYGIGAINAHTGDLVYQQIESATVLATHALYSEISQRYPKAERIYLIQDNRPVHLHPNLLAALLPQTSSFDKPLPPSWSGKLSKKIGELEKLPIEILQLPTYAPWTNPIEKLWRWVRQAVLHLHRLADDWKTLQQRVLDFMEHFRGGSKKLLRYVGLLPV